MTLLDERTSLLAPAPPAQAADPSPSGEVPGGVGLACASVLLSTLAAAWLLASVFAGPLAKVVAVGSAVTGPLLVLLSYRSRRPAVLQYLALPIALAGGALLVLPGATGGSANLPGLVAEAVQSGGLSQPPVPFEPGWRFLLVVLLVLLGTGASSLAVATARPRVGLLVPLPVVVGASLVQPPSSAVAASIVALLLMVAALVVASGAQLVQEGSSSGAFEARRLLNGLGAIGVLGVVLVVLSQAGFLFPSEPRDTVVPPTRPEAQPPLSDRVLFSVSGKEVGPWRLGVLDVYDERAWLLPPFDRSRFVALPTSGEIPDPPSGTTRELTVSVGDLPGSQLPTLEGVAEATGDGVDLAYDPRTQMLRSVTGRARKGSTYTISAVTPPSAADLAKVGAETPADVVEFRGAPAPPADVQDLLAQAPEAPFRRLQFLRNALYQQVVAAGKGQPVDVPPRRVSEMLNGGEATPYEITAAEALLARWAGVPARVGYGFYGGEQVGSVTEIHPRHGATWLEAYFPGHGWITIVGRPPKAKESTSLDDQTKDDQIRASEDLSLIVYVPVELENLRQLYDDVRFYALVSLPWVALLALAIGYYPWLLKQLRRWRRRRWAMARGPAARVLVAYAELRDRLVDVHAPNPSATPLEFVASVDFDEEHWELAWLVSRGLWGDLRRDLRAEDAEAAEDMARSVTARTLRAQRVVPRLLAAASRASLRRPWSDEIPNVWPSGARVRRVRRALRRLSPLRLARAAARTATGLRPRRALRGTALLLVLLVAATTLTGCGSGSRATTPASLPERLVPDAVGDYLLQREPSAERAFDRAGDAALVTDGHVYTIRRGQEVFGSFQAANFKRRRGVSLTKVQRGLRASLGTGDFRLERLGTETVYVLEQAERRILLAFPPGGGYYQMMDARQGFADADRVFLGILSYQRGVAIDLGRETTVVDVRRGGD